MTREQLPPLTDDLVIELLTHRLGRSRHDNDECDGLVTVSLALSGHAAPEDLETVGAHMQHCRVCADNVRTWQKTMHAPTVAIQQRTSLFSRAMPRMLAVGMASVLVAVTAMVVWREQGDTNVVPRGQLAMKGATDSLDVAIARGEQRLRLSPEQTLKDGDRLGFFYSSTTAGYLALLSVSQGGTTSVIYPLNGNDSTPISAGVNQQLPDGGVFAQHAPCEWLVGVFSDRPLALMALVGKAQRAAQQATRDCTLPLVVDEARTVVILR
jgi:hypothetical protein